MAALLGVGLAVSPGAAQAQDEVRLIEVLAGHYPDGWEGYPSPNLLNFIFSHPIATTSPPRYSDLTVIKDGRTVGLKTTGIGWGPKAGLFQLQLYEDIVQSKTLTFSYTKPTRHRRKLTTTGGVDVESFTLDLSPPTAERSRVRDSLLDIHFDKTLRATPVPATATFSVTADGNEVDVSAVAIKGSVVTLTLAAAVNQGETVKVSYTKPADGRLQGTVRTVVPSFTDLGVTNTSAGPTVDAAAIASTPSFDTDGDNTADTYGPGETIRVRLTFSEAVDVDTSGGVPSVKIRMDPDHDGITATYENHTLSAVNFIYTVAEPDVSTAGIAVLEDTLALNGGTIRAAAGAKTHAWIRHDGIAHDAGHKVHWLEGVPRPTVDTVAIESTPSFDTDGDDTADTYGPGETIRVRLTFSKAVDVDTSGGVPSVKIRMDPDYGEFAATYEGHTLTEVDFVHTVAEPNISTAGIAVLEDTLALNGGTIRAATGAQVPALLRHDGIAHDAEHKVHWLEGVPRPTVEAVAIESTPSFDTDGDNTADTYGTGETIRVRLTFSEAVAVDTSGGAPSLSIRMDPDHDGVAATYESHTLTTVDFVHTVAEPNVSAAGIAVLDNTLALNGGAIRATTGSQLPASLRHDGIPHDAGHKVDWRLRVTPQSRQPQGDRPPRFGAAAVGPLALVAGEAMAPVVLPAASGGNGALSYSLTSRPAGLAGLSFDPATRRLSGTPGSEGRYVFVYRAEDADSNRSVSDTAELTFVVTVEPPRMALLRTAVTRTLAAVARRTLSSALSNIGARFAASVPGTGLTLAGRRLPLAAAGTVGMDGAAGSCSGASRGHGPGAGTDVCVPAGMRSGGMTTEELLRSSAFPLGPAAGAGSGQSAPAAARWALWGRGDLGSFEGRPEPGTHYEGELRTGWLGIDARAGRWVAGLAFSHGRGEADYRVEDAGRGRLETTLSALYPYGRWSFDDGLELRMVLGTGTGEAR
ncbi:MAG: SwmB domain-containing protein, partial [Deltaproteobacteria bacterium]|nr:SwmB domain-containing protein [Deltaproteobacteria bacterium]